MTRETSGYPEYRSAAGDAHITRGFFNQVRESSMPAMGRKPKSKKAKVARDALIFKISSTECRILRIWLSNLLLQPRQTDPLLSTDSGLYTVSQPHRLGREPRRTRLLGTGFATVPSAPAMRAIATILRAERTPGALRSGGQAVSGQRSRKVRWNDTTPASLERQFDSNVKSEAVSPFSFHDLQPCRAGGEHRESCSEIASLPQVAASITQDLLDGTAFRQGPPGSQSNDSLHSHNTSNGPSLNTRVRLLAMMDIKQKHTCKRVFQWMESPSPAGAPSAVLESEPGPRRVRKVGERASSIRRQAAGVSRYSRNTGTVTACVSCGRLFTPMKRRMVEMLGPLTMAGCLRLLQQAPTKEKTSTFGRGTNDESRLPNDAETADKSG